MNRLAVRVRVVRAAVIVSAIFALVAIFADFLASDLPIMSKISGKIWLFPNVTRPAALTKMTASERANATEWQLPALVAHGPLIANEDPAARLRGPFALPGHPLGTDRAGRDIFARCVHGARNYLVFALAAVIASLVLGSFFGGVAGLFGGVTDAFVNRAIETISAFPALVLILGIQAAVPHATLTTLFFAIALTRWPEIARLVRAEVMRIEARDYVMAARALGASPLRVLWRHVLPNIRGQVAALGAFGIPAVVLVEASLDFLRIGIGETTSASWGETMSQFRGVSHAWWLLAFPGILLFVMVVAMNIVGEALRASSDPRGR
ncbi:MAG: ABC transporter permease [Polyangiaceae bacterium]|nr:ABC transporter permease [Polyangiaceae bacterium]